MTMRPGGPGELFVREGQLTRLVLLPAVAVGLLLVGLGVGSRLFPAAAIFQVSRAVPFEEALRTDEEETVFEALRAGTDPNLPVEVRDAALTGGRSVRVLPVTLAVATGSEHALQVLLGYGAVVDAARAARLQCLAIRAGRSTVIPVLTPLGGSVDPSRCEAIGGATNGAALLDGTGPD